MLYSSSAQGLAKAQSARVWCITGYKGVGKDEIAKMLVAMGWVAHQFIDPAYRAVAMAYGIHYDLLRESPFKDTPQQRLGGRSPRQLVARMCDHIREDTPTGMVDLWLEACASEKYARVVATGLREPDEIRAAAQAGAAIVRVHRAGFTPYDKYDRLVDTIPADVELHNDGTIYDLRQLVHAALGMQLPEPHPLLKG